MAACVALTLLLIGGSPARAAAAWWSPVALRGTAITRVSAMGDTIMVRTAKGATLLSTDGGSTFATAPATAALPPLNVVTIGKERWEIDPAGRVLHAVDTAVSTTPLVDPGSPGLGAGADLIAASVALPEVVVAVSTDGTVWRRGQDGDWKRALLLLPASLVEGVPRITSVTAFTEPLSASSSGRSPGSSPRTVAAPDAIYLGTDGYADLISTDGGDDWIRAGPGLPASVFSLSADSRRHAVYAGTSDGLWKHALQNLPAPPAYQDAALVWRWLGIGAVTLVASAAALLAMVRLVPRRLEV